MDDHQLERTAPIPASWLICPCQPILAFSGLLRRVSKMDAIVAFNLQVESRIKCDICPNLHEQSGGILPWFRSGSIMLKYEVEGNRTEWRE